MLQGQVEGAVFADLYAGTGAVGIEALSRGARRAVFVEESPFAARVIRRNLEMLGLAKRAHVRRTAVRRVIGRLDAEMYFLGPPYDAHGEYRRTLEALSRCELAVAIAQHSRSLDLGRRYGRLERARLVISGRNRISIFRPRADP